ncbi:MAG: cation:proton antiporter [Flintibacter sp.]|uniref:cation:proton antiporter domain-containing protein n=1 Tax=Flintibacter sp. TaxID=1918624 RepID=UPI00267227DF|nr:cation:proton antiporter [Flintibacter sp.]MCI6150109.1 cation:proton antiporter [Flintibacter sp.]MDD7116724.1 cation:proton antiporter [Flintibacter sp.]MDY5037245.1 cation:proton antiporter [Lawsonibacter sp.]
MLTSLGLVLLLGMALGALAKRLKLPSLVGMLIAGMILGPYALNLLSDSLLNISADLRQLALIIILTRAGLSLDVEALKRVGRPAILMCFVPACFEILGMTLLAPALLGVSTLDAAIMGAVVGAVSPAVIVPRMIRLSEEGWGVDRGIPQLILAGASVDDVFVIVMFTAFTGLASGGTGLTAGAVLSIPASILTGVAAGLLLGWLLAQWFRRVHMRDSVKVVILLSLAFLLVAAEDALEGIFPFSGLLAVMGAGVGLQRWRSVVAQRLSLKFSKLWVAAEVALFVLVGAAVDLRYALSAGIMAILAVLGALCFRAVGVLVCVSGAHFSPKEKLFCVLSYLPKATVQAAIGGVPLAMGLGCGQIVLTVAVIAILVTAPLGALAIDRSYPKLLTQRPPE